jgi:hypothetical protein
MYFSHLHTSPANLPHDSSDVYYRSFYAWVLYAFLLYLRSDGGLVAIVKAL